MKPHSLFALVLSGIFLCVHANVAAAHPGHEHSEESSPGMRIWKDATGTFELRASFVAVADNNVQLRKPDGALLSVALDRLSGADRQWVVQREAEIRRLNVESPPARGVPVQVAADDDAIVAQAEVSAAPTTTRRPGEPDIHAHFQPFAQTLKLRWDDRFYYVGSNGMPDHPMMIGIRAWQQQVPLPQKYFDDNAWRIPLHPKPAAEPASAKGRFLRGAIALAVNGVPIFNPLNNRGDDAYLFGELDEWGGHCGRADDYHYHTAPVHLEKTVGKGSPIAYALDGYPIYGYDEADGSKVTGLDWLNGHQDAAGNYHYHATKTYPYLNGGFYGEIVERDGQVDPQPRAQPVREFLPPLRGAKITDFKSTKPGSYELTYDVGGKPGYVRYTIAASGAVDFTFVDAGGKSTTESYTPGRRPGGGGGGGGPKPGQGGPEGKRPPPRPGERRPQPNGERPRDEASPPDDARRPMPGGEASRGPAPGGARKPWISEHFTELDANRDDVLTRDEMDAEAERTVEAYDTDGDGRLVKREYDRGGVKSAFAGFVRGHAAEVDEDGDEVITKQEVLDFAANLFAKSDRDGDGRASLADASAQGAAKRAEDGSGEKKRPKQ